MRTSAHRVPRLRFYSVRDLEDLPQLQKLPADYRWAMTVVANVLPFRTNNYVVEELINWERVPEDPIFQLTFPQPGMLDPVHFRHMSGALQRGGSPEHVR